ncbi:hypothetical protein [Streptomyces sp. NPDC002324]
MRTDLRSFGGCAAEPSTLIYFAVSAQDLMVSTARRFFSMAVLASCSFDIFKKVLVVFSDLTIFPPDRTHVTPFLSTKLIIPMDVLELTGSLMGAESDACPSVTSDAEIEMLEQGSIVPIITA